MRQDVAVGNTEFGIHKMADIYTRPNCLGRTLLHAKQKMYINTKLFVYLEHGRKGGGGGGGVEVSFLSRCGTMSISITRKFPFV